MTLTERFISPLSTRNMPPKNYEWTRSDKRRCEYAERRVALPPPQDLVVLRAIEDVGDLVTFDGCGFYTKDYGIQFVPFVVWDGTMFLVILPNMRKGKMFPSFIYAGLADVLANWYAPHNHSQQVIAENLRRWKSRGYGGALPDEFGVWW